MNFSKASSEVIGSSIKFFSAENPYPIYEELHRKTSITYESLTQNSIFEDSSLTSKWVVEIQEKEKTERRKRRWSFHIISTARSGGGGGDIWRGEERVAGKEE